MRTDQRANDQLRPVSVTRRFTEAPAGSVLWKQGKTVVLCTAAIRAEVPPWFAPDRPGGWITAEYVMLPASTPQHKPWPRIGHTDSRGTEIQRIIGRALRAVVDLSKIGPHTIAVDCQVLQADGGTRTAAICGAYLAVRDAIAALPAELPAPPPRATATGVPAQYDPAFYKPAEAIVDWLAAVSVGVVEGEVLLDLDYADDSRANVDMNVAYTAGGRLVEIQGSAENGQGFDRATLDRLLDMAIVGCRQLLAIEQQAMAGT